MPNLEAVVSHSPADSAELAACGLSVEQWANSPYPLAAMLLGSARVEFGWGPEAEQALRRGLLMTPHNPMLAAEAGTALVMQKRFADVVVLADGVLNSGETLEDKEHARLLRVRGYALVELNRLDEAETSYRDSLRFDPGNPTAPEELEYLRQLREGGERVEGEVINTPPSQPVRPNDGT